MSREEVINLMSSSKSFKEWNDNCKKVKEAHGGNYPATWFEDIITSGLCDKALGTGASQFKVTTGKEALKDL
jgi:hypothetical protein